MRRSKLVNTAAALFLAAAAAHAGAQNSLPTDTKPTAFSAPFSADEISAGSAQYNRTCAQCHGRNMVNSGTTSYDLRRFPVDQVDRFLLAVNKGKGNMPSFEAALTPEQIKVLWAYVGTRGGKEP
jgi:cytochrome c6